MGKSRRQVCGNDELPSIEEVVVMAGHLMKAADAQKRSMKENSSKTFDRVSPRLVVVVDFTGRCRILSGYYDGTRHVHFTRILNFQEFTARPPTGKEYIDSIDKKKYFQMINLILKWTWPIAVGTTHGEARSPVISETNKESSEALVTPSIKRSGENPQPMVIRIMARVATT
ncbi:hypothetical protein N7451_003369 [Penicillium sp. IBT 35674x]|nr:hypothetical protein N7451_003369 [Penicillium sp. IBT 35674x]